MRHAAVGNLLLVLCVGSFCYVTLWLLITPFIDPDQPVLKAFPPTSCLYLPLGAFITSFIAAALGYVGWLMLLEPAAAPKRS